MCVLAAIYFI